MRRAMIRVILAGAVVCSTAVVSTAQQTTTSAETKTFEVLAVDGNQLVVRLPEGTRELTVADDFGSISTDSSCPCVPFMPGFNWRALTLRRRFVR